MGGLRLGVQPLGPHNLEKLYISLDEIDVIYITGLHLTASRRFLRHEAPPQATSRKMVMGRDTV